MSDDVRKILEAVARGEISPEEGERLLKALQAQKGEGEEKTRKRLQELDEREYVLRKGETVEGKLVLSGKKTLIEGRVIGDLVLLSCDSFFSGEVEGNMVVIGGKIVFAGGTVKKDLVLVGAEEEGEKPKVGGSVTHISNFLVETILKMVSPLVGNIVVTPGKKEKEDEVS